MRLGQRVSMLCSVTDGDLPLTLKWYRHDQLLLPEAAASGISITEIGHYESVLRIDNLRPEHNANFTCVAKNFAGVAQHSQTLRVKGRKIKKILYTALILQGCVFFRSWKVMMISFLYAKCVFFFWFFFGNS